MDISTPFEISYRDETLQVIPRKIGRDYVYIIDFPSRRPPMMLTKATRDGGKTFWTTVPEAKEKKAQEAALAEAAVFGELITGYFKESLKP